MLTAVLPCPTDLISRNLDSVAAAMNGSWSFDKSRSDSIGPFLKFLGLPWALQKLAESSTLTRTFQLSASGLIDTQITTGMLGKTLRQEWFWSETPMTLPLSGTFPAFVTLHTDGPGWTTSHKDCPRERHNPYRFRSSGERGCSFDLNSSHDLCRQ
jgi:hypothetical protein